MNNILEIKDLNLKVDKYQELNNANLVLNKGEKLAVLMPLLPKHNDKYHFELADLFIDSLPPVQSGSIQLNDKVFSYDQLHLIDTQEFFKQNTISVSSITEKILTDNSDKIIIFDYSHRRKLNFDDIKLIKKFPDVSFIFLTCSRILAEEFDRIYLFRNKGFTEEAKHLQGKIDTIEEICNVLLMRFFDSIIFPEVEMYKYQKVGTYGRRFFDRDTSKTLLSTASVKDGHGEAIVVETAQGDKMCIFDNKEFFNEYFSYLRESRGIDPQYEKYIEFFNSVFQNALVYDYSKIKNNLSTIEECIEFLFKLLVQINFNNFSQNIADIDKIQVSDTKLELFAYLFNYLGVVSAFIVKDYAFMKKMTNKLSITPQYGCLSATCFKKSIEGQKKVFDIIFDKYLNKKQVVEDVF